MWDQREESIQVTGDQMIDSEIILYVEYNVPQRKTHLTFVKSSLQVLSVFNSNFLRSLFSFRSSETRSCIGDVKSWNVNKYSTLKQWSNFFTFNIECSVTLTIYAFDSVKVWRNTRLILIQNHKTLSLNPVVF